MLPMQKVLSDGQPDVLVMPSVEAIRRDAQAATVISVQVSCEPDRAVTLIITLTSGTSNNKEKRP